MKKEKVMDWMIFIGIVVVFFFVVIFMMVFLKVSEDIIIGINSVIFDLIGLIYLFMGLVIFCFVMYIVFGKYGNVIFGKVSDKLEFNIFIWVVMLFCVGIGFDILYWGVIEWVFYY